MSESFWNQRASDCGHTGWSNQLIYKYDQPLRIKALIRIIKSTVKNLSSMSALDIGCGTGDLVNELAGLGVRVTGIDISSAVLEIAKSRSFVPNNSEYINKSILDIQDKEQFQVITSITVLQHIINDGQLEQALQNIHDALHKRGWFIFLELAPSTDESRDYGGHVKVHSEKEWVTYVNDVGFELIEQHTFPQTGVLVLEYLSRVIVRGGNSRSGVNQENDNDFALVSFINMRAVLRRWLKKILTALVLSVCFPLDHLLNIKLSRKKSLYKIFVFRKKT